MLYVDEYGTGIGTPIQSSIIPTITTAPIENWLNQQTPQIQGEKIEEKPYSPYEEAQKKQEEAMLREVEEWLLALAREDQIRYEQYEREDTAWQRAKADAVKAGIDLNLVNAGPASTGAGITNASRIDKTERIANTQTARELLIQQIAQKFEQDENRKDRTEKYLNNAMDNLTSILNKVLDKVLPSLNATAISKIK